MEFASGTVTLDVNDSKWQLGEGGGNRSCTQVVAFNKKFSTMPKVVVGLTHIDISNEFNSRLSVTARKISESKFELEFSTWNDTLVFGASVQWFAYADDTE